MKMIVAHLAHDAFEPVRSELLDLGVVRVATCEVRCYGLETQTTLRHKGASVCLSSSSQLRLECVVSDSQAASVVDALRRHTMKPAHSAGQVAVVDLQEVHHGPSTVRLYPDDPRLDGAVA